MSFKAFKLLRKIAQDNFGDESIAKMFISESFSRSEETIDKETALKGVHLFVYYSIISFGIHSLIHLFIHSFIHSSIHSFVHILVYTSTHSPVQLFIY